MRKKLLETNEFKKYRPPVKGHNEFEKSMMCLMLIRFLMLEDWIIELRSLR